MSDYFDEAADQILAARRAKRPPPPPIEEAPKPRRVLRPLERMLQPILARVWLEGAEAGAEAVSACCGCSASLPPNPYEEV